MGFVLTSWVQAPGAATVALLCSAGEVEAPQPTLRKHHSDHPKSAATAQTHRAAAGARRRGGVGFSKQAVFYGGGPAFTT